MQWYPWTSLSPCPLFTPCSASMQRPSLGPHHMPLGCSIQGPAKRSLWRLCLSLCTWQPNFIVLLHRPSHGPPVSMSFFRIQKLSLNPTYTGTKMQLNHLSVQEETYLIVAQPWGIYKEYTYTGIATEKIKSMQGWLPGFSRFEAQTEGEIEFPRCSLWHQYYCTPCHPISAWNQSLWPN